MKPPSIRIDRLDSRPNRGAVHGDAARTPCRRSAAGVNLAIQGRGGRRQRPDPAGSC
ncbi:hypothetical protein M8494_18505 [Serratia ureilytica]